jgi:5-methylcytosine-specific restriction protein B
VDGKLQSDADLKAELKAVIAGSALSTEAQGWYAELATFLAYVKASIPSKLEDQEFLKRLWEDQAVSSTGNGSVKIGPALANAEFRHWFATEVTKPLPDDDLASEARLTELYDGLRDQLQKFGRTPLLKINRVLCAIYPEHFTTIADVGKLKVLHREMGGSKGDHPVHVHKTIRKRIDNVLKDVALAEPLSPMRRICLPWMLYERISNEAGGDVAKGVVGSLTALSPLPATLRRKGLTAMKGGFQTLLGFLPELNEGITREEFADLIKQANPDLAPNSIGTSINVVAREFDVCKREGDTYRLSARGINLLETQDPDELADHLVTKILGVDHVLKQLESNPQTKSQLMAMLQAVNPGWTTDFAPSSLLGWLTSLSVIEVSDSKHLKLSERGRRWADMVTWMPQYLPKPAETVAELKATISTAVELPTLSELQNRLEKLVAGRLTLDSQLVAQLHAGLWFHPVRHFVVLTGISGSGKTQLALNYALALCNSQQNDHGHVRVIPVQPGWYDPSPLLGYVNPIQDTSYRSAPFLDLLLRAAGDPDQPYVVILDEMNLSHPEQYLAPVLSAMETHGWLDLHQLGEDTTSVPQRVKYPANLAIIGTLNMDETTHGLSDKVLDRAYTLEFWNISVDDFPGWETVSLPDDLKDKTRNVLNGLVKALAPVRLHFGWRTIDDVLSYLVFQAANSSNETSALDNVIYAKVLPKLRGETSQRFQKALQDIYETLVANGLVRCSEKVKSMQEDLVATGSARYWR